MENPQSPNKALIAIIVVVLLVAAGTAAIVLTNSKSATDSSSTATTDTPTTSPVRSSEVPANATFNDGTYTATGSYQTPGGQESIGVKVTLADGVITDAQVTKQGKTGEAQEYQGEFVANFKPKVVGKKISEVSLSRVAGSSLTSGGFNDALNDIEKQAQA